MSIGIERLTRKTIAWIRSWKPKDAVLEVGISGGKDSIVLYDLMQKAGVEFRAFYNFSAIEPPASLPFIRRHLPDVKVLRRPDNFWKLLLKHGYPTMTRRWCCYELKEKPHPQVLGRYKVFGVRKEESWRRASRPRISRWGGAKSRRVYYLSPIFEWKEWQIWEYIEKHDLPVHPDYDRGLNRIGCVVCPFICTKDRRKVDFHKKLYPKQYKMFEKVMTKVYEQKVRKMREFYSEDELVRTPEEFIDNWYRGSFVPYLRKPRKKRPGDGT